MAKKGVNIHKRKDGRWEGRYPKGRNENGALIYGYVYGEKYADVKEKMMEAIAETTRQNALSSLYENPLFEDVLTRWLSHNVIRQKRATVTKYRFLIEQHLVPDLGAFRMDELSATMLNAYLTEKLQNGRIDGKGGLSPSTVRSLSILIRSAVKFAADEGWCAPMKSPIYKPTLSKKDLSVLTVEQQRRLEQYCQKTADSTAVGIMLSLHAGLRIGEICALSWDDVDENAKIISVRHTVARVQNPERAPGKTMLIEDSPKTEASIRQIPISSVLWPVLENAKSHKNTGYILSETAQFLNPRTLEYRYHKALKTCGLDDVNFHTLRHTFATRCIEVGVDVKSLSEMLGHANTSVTLETYVHSSMTLKRTQLEKLAAVSK